MNGNPPDTAITPTAVPIVTATATDAFVTDTFVVFDSEDFCAVSVMLPGVVAVGALLRCPHGDHYHYVEETFPFRHGQLLTPQRPSTSTPVAS